MSICPVCRFRSNNWGDVASHIHDMTSRSDPPHVMWLNRNLSSREVSSQELAGTLEDYFSLKGGLSSWIRGKVIEKIYGERPHPFILAMQKPNRAVLLGYVIEHRHFLRNWIRVLSMIVYKTDKDDVARYELENISQEFLGNGSPPHYELLIRMGESLGLTRDEIMSYDPLPSTSSSIKVWRNIAETRSWVETMASMHSMELIADKSLRNYGSKMHYFNPSILTDQDYPDAVKKFLAEGYNADEYHAWKALELVEKYSQELGVVEDVQVSFLRSLDALSKYLMARLERAMEFDPNLIKFVEAVT
ncbi:TenA family transcriptional regulator [Metallosphaera tengchongensis]|uniref:TenA family transcriptional regulator n=1 Tax=Metallosphaera tengchongensis TaxID=1532350 RepID=A0A6N0NZT8_9CREN|nr:C2H2 type zinc finger domain-containing protein [Metallosphaera tengchongensis]QKR00651.1 TenA family transcriptional regulator [Metallosphaera tengchongensis]